MVILLSYLHTGKMAFYIELGPCVLEEYLGYEEVL